MERNKAYNYADILPDANGYWAVGLKKIFVSYNDGDGKLA